MTHKVSGDGDFDSALLIDMTRAEDRFHRLTRLFVIANRLERGGPICRSDLAAACGCTPRTITRDLVFLQEAGIDVIYDSRQHTYRLQAPLPFESIGFSLSEVLALATARENLQRQSGLPGAGAIRTALNRIAARLPEALRELLESTQQVLSFGPHLRRDYSQAPWQEVTEAARRRQTIEMHYHTQSRDEWSVRRVDPYLVAERGGYLQLVAFCHTRQEVREFSLDRIRAPHPTGETFSIPPEFCLDQYLHASVGVLRGEPTPIVVRFDPAVAAYAKSRSWTFPCELQEQPDGSLLLHGTVSGVEEIRAELLSWGANVEVLEPPHLRDLMRTHAEAIAARHRETTI